MKPSRRDGQRFFLVALGFGILCHAAGCTTSPENILSAKNLTPSGIVVFAYKDGTLVDPVPTLPAGSFEKQIIAPGRTRSLEPPRDYQPGQGVFLFIYQVPPDRTEAVFYLAWTVSAAELAKNHGLIMIRPNISIRSEGP